MSTDANDLRNRAVSASLPAQHSFRVGPCPDCDRQVLTSRDLVDDELIARCLHCEAPLDSDTIQWAAPKDVVELGYFIDGYQVPDSESKEGGCRGGACGVQQPESGTT